MIIFFVIFFSSMISCFFIPERILFVIYFSTF